MLKLLDTLGKNNRSELTYHKDELMVQSQDLVWTGEGVVDT